MMMTRMLFFSFVLLAQINFSPVHAEDALSQYSALTNAGLLVVNAQGQSVIADHAQKPFIPASTTKLVTAWLALNHWGAVHRFRTEFYLDSNTNTLWVKGSGDPFLVSEELAFIAGNLKQRGIQKLSAIGLDSSFFQPDLLLPGTGRTDNPYDAVSSAIAANFNTVNINKFSGRVSAAEPETPLTAYAKKLSQRLSNGTWRINTGHDPRNAEKYFAELLSAFLRQQNVKVGKQIIYGTNPVLQPFYTHVSSKTLAEMIRPMLKYSTNFIANQLILMLSAEVYQRPANAADVQSYMQETLAHHFHWKNFSLQDGAGLSTANRLSPAQLVDLLQAFSPWKHLLPEIETAVYAKTGTLEKVSTLAGYLVHKNRWEPFALMINQSVPGNLRNRIALKLVSLQGKRILDAALISVAR
jgi:serine-type D-Ala-D-Ala carboxypeptidase/endopeptidase (penicillin-binding protein 4)